MRGAKCERIIRETENGERREGEMEQDEAEKERGIRAKEVVRRRRRRRVEE